jgi:aryl-alcohol dehydrogenase-like predicted oxidoreductase
MHLHKLSRFILGTAQFGLDYGVANSAGKVAPDEAAEILAFAKSRGIVTLDTAIAYGDSESVLGEIGVSNWQVITKLPFMPEDCKHPYDWLSGQLESSLKRLKIGKVHAVLLHRPDQLLGTGGSDLYEALCRAREAGLTEKIGLSVYDAALLRDVIGPMEFDIVQAPFNLIDRRIIATGWTEKLHLSGCELHVRSIFLQGLLLMSRKQRPEYFAAWQDLFDALDAWLERYSISPLAASLRFALNTPEIDKIVFGVVSVGQLKEILMAAEGELPPVPDALACQDERLVNPSNWKLV